MVPGRHELAASANLFDLSVNLYPGIGIVVGLDMTSRFLVQIFWIMGHSPNSRNRVFKKTDKGCLYIEAADPSKMKALSLIIYNAMRETAEGKHFIVSNGDQTDTVTEWLENGNPPYLVQALAGCQYEPDGPIFTPRITAVSSLGPSGEPTIIQISILRKSRFGDGCDHINYCYNELLAGFGLCITTYSGDGNPPPAFCGDPLLMPLDGVIEDIAETYWDALDEENRVALAAKFIDRNTGRSEIHIINKYKQV